MDIGGKRCNGFSTVVLCEKVSPHTVGGNGNP